VRHRDHGGGRGRVLGRLNRKCRAAGLAYEHMDPRESTKHVHHGGHRKILWQEAIFSLAYSMSFQGPVVVLKKGWL
jgi:hypothetical protein